jgi:hypothetical protein
MQLASSRILVVVAPSNDLGEQLFNEAKKWHELGLIRDFFWIEASEETKQALGDFKLKFQSVSDDPTEVENDFLQFLGGIEVQHLDLVVPWFLGDAAPDEHLALFSVKLGKAISDVLPKAAQIGNVTNKRLFTTLLSIPSIESVGHDLNPVPFGFDLFDQNVYISPEARATPWAGSAPVLSANGTLHFALSQICTVGGVWAGSSESLSAMLRARNYEFTTGNILVMRSITTAVVANGVASQIVIEALTKVGDPEFDLYANTDANDKQRPVALLIGQRQLRDQFVTQRVEEILARSDKAFTYEKREAFVKPDHGRGFAPAVKFFWNFTKETVKGFPLYTKYWFQNKRNKTANSLFGDVVEAVPEGLDGYDEMLRKMLVEVEKFNADAAIQDSIAVSKEAFSQNPGIWKLLREIAFSSVDGFGAKSETKAQVLPTVDDVVSDPAERFEIDPQFAEHLELQDSSIGFEQVAELRQKLAADLSASNIRIDQLREQLIDLQRQREAEAEAQRIADEQAAEEAEAQRVADEQAAEEAEAQRVADEQAAEEAEAQRVADEQAAKEAVSESEEELVSESEEELVAESEELIEAGNEEAPELSAEESQVTKRRAASKSSSVAAKKLVPGSSGSDDKPIDSKKRGKK